MDSGTSTSHTGGFPDEFSFDDIPDDKDLPEETTEFDAINDETFGGDVGPLDAELEDYAAQVLLFVS